MEAASADGEEGKGAREGGADRRREGRDKEVVEDKNKATLASDSGRWRCLSLSTLQDSAGN